MGRVMVYAGNPTWLFMYMDDASWQGTLRCEVVLDQGLPSRWAGSGCPGAKGRGRPAWTSPPGA